jgi:hypothetical protein
LHCEEWVAFAVNEGLIAYFWRCRLSTIFRHPSATTKWKSWVFTFSKGLNVAVQNMDDPAYCGISQPWKCWKPLLYCLGSLYLNNNLYIINIACPVRLTEDTHIESWVSTQKKRKKWHGIETYSDFFFTFLYFWRLPNSPYEEKRNLEKTKRHSSPRWRKKLGNLYQNMRDNLIF